MLREWFYDVNLTNVFIRAAWLVLMANTTSEVRPTWQEVQDVTEETYDVYLDECMNRKGIMTAVDTIFSIIGLTVRNRVARVLQNMHGIAAIHLQSQGPFLRDDFHKVQTFMEKWIADSLDKLWCILRDLLTEEVAVNLFEELIAPFGQDNEYSCVPWQLWKDIGRPPPHWNIVREQVHDVFERWQDAPRRRVRRRTGGRDDGEPGELTLARCPLAACEASHRRPRRRRAWGDKKY